MTWESAHESLPYSGGQGATNSASRQVMEKCGLRLQGELPMAGTVVAWYAIDRVD
jgi:hypothetical protein